MFLTYELSYKRNEVALCHEVGDVIEFQFIISTRNDGLIATLYGDNMIRIVWSTKYSERSIEDFSRFTQFYAEHYECSVMHIPALPYPRHL